LKGRTSALVNSSPYIDFEKRMNTKRWCGESAFSMISIPPDRQPAK
jgi:hypothetical protein